MTIISVANIKGGVGKSTLATNIAGFFASKGHQVCLGDVDKQQSSQLWLGLRPPSISKIQSWPINFDHITKAPQNCDYAVMDTPAGLHGWRLKEILSLSDKVIVPIQPSIFDIFASREFLNELNQAKRHTRFSLGIIGMRVDERTLAATQLKEFMKALDVPVLGFIRDTQYYIQMAAHGFSLFDMSPSRVQKDLEQWKPITEWLLQKD
jgi:chromosome partitioning protein